MTEMNNAARVMLVNPVTSQSHLLSHGDRVEVMATEPEVTYNLFVGDEAYLREIQENLLPAEITLKQNYPNPFNPSTTIQYALPADEIVNLEVYDILGRRVQVLQDGFQQAGWHHVRFDGAGQASGVYIYRLVAGEQHLTGKMTLIK
ncbi:MAG: T9SS type A sorting domain-containing protein, partial [Balneolales bacterium]